MIEIAVDIGGTFTDVVLLRDSRHLFFTKVPSTPRNPVEAVRRGAERALALAGGAPADVRRFMHGTTVATNAVIERKGGITGVLMTEGFEDALEIGRQKRTAMYDLGLDPETPVFLAPRRCRVGIPERIDAEGNVLIPLDEAAVRRAVRYLRDRYGVESIAVCYLFSFQNPVHEQRTRAIIREVAPELRVSLSSEVDPTFREYERVCVTAFDAYLRPVIEDYMVRLEQELAAAGIAARLQIMQSRGGLTAAAAAQQQPVSLFLSGPAGGVIGATYAAAQSGAHDLISIDIGGTSSDVALVRGGRPTVAPQGTIITYPVRKPMIDVNTIGAGGGSIVWIDAGGGLRVGPHSAGAEPGPICYGRGGQQVTVTDASVVLGYLNPKYFANGELQLDVEAARAGVDALARRLGIDSTATALGIHQVVNARMADQIRLVSIRRGYDPREFSLVALGGAGPVHGGALARELGIPTVIVPRAPGVLSAFGLLVARVERDQIVAFRGRADAIAVDDLLDAFQRIDAACHEKMKQEDVPLGEVRIAHSAELRYVGQSYELEVPVREPLGPGVIQQLVADFHALHARIYGHAEPTEPVEFVNLRTVHAYAPPTPELGDWTGGPSLQAALKDERPACFSDTGFIPTPVYDRVRLPVGEPVVGPAIVEQADTTTVIYPGQQGQVDRCGNLIVRSIDDGNERIDRHRRSGDA